jgi:hypothetical protein
VAAGHFHLPVHGSFQAEQKTAALRASAAGAAALVAGDAMPVLIQEGTAVRWLLEGRGGAGAVGPDLGRQGRSGLSPPVRAEMVVVGARGDCLRWRMEVLAMAEADDAAGCYLGEVGRLAAHPSDRHAPGSEEAGAAAPGRRLRHRLLAWQSLWRMK